MTDYTLYYWPLPFRGQFVRSVLAHVDATWDEAGVEAISTLRRAAPSTQSIPHMGPPVLTDHATGFSLAQTPAILGFLGSKYGLVPTDPEREALCAPCSRFEARVGLFQARAISSACGGTLSRKSCELPT